MDSLYLIKSKLETFTYTDPWDKEVKEQAYVVVDDVIVYPTGDKHEYSNGYVDQLDDVYVDEETGDLCHKYVSIDYANNTSYLWLPGSTRDGHYRKPSMRVRYVREGDAVLWDEGWVYKGVNLGTWSK